jgi:hypothetical protein
MAQATFALRLHASKLDIPEPFIWSANAADTIEKAKRARAAG